MSTGGLSAPLEAFLLGDEDQEVIWTPSKSTVDHLSVPDIFITQIPDDCPIEIRSYLHDCSREGYLFFRTQPV